MDGRAAASAGSPARNLFGTPSASPNASPLRGGIASADLDLFASLSPMKLGASPELALPPSSSRPRPTRAAPERLPDPTVAELEDAAAKRKRKRKNKRVSVPAPARVPTPDGLGSGARPDHEELFVGRPPPSLVAARVHTLVLPRLTDDARAAKYHTVVIPSTVETNVARWRLMTPGAQIEYRNKWLREETRSLMSPHSLVPALSGAMPEAWKAAGRRKDEFLRRHDILNAERRLDANDSIQAMVAYAVELATFIHEELRALADVRCPALTDVVRFLIKENNAEYETACAWAEAAARKYEAAVRAAMDEKMAIWKYRAVDSARRAAFAALEPFASEVVPPTVHFSAETAKRVRGDTVDALKKKPGRPRLLDADQARVRSAAAAGALEPAVFERFEPTSDADTLVARRELMDASAADPELTTCVSVRDALRKLVETTSQVQRVVLARARAFPKAGKSRISADERVVRTEVVKYAEMLLANVTHDVEDFSRRFAVFGLDPKTDAVFNVSFFQSGESEGEGGAGGGTGGGAGTRARPAGIRACPPPPPPRPGSATSHGATST